MGVDRGIDLGFVGRRTHDGEVADELAPWVGSCPLGHVHYRYREPIRPLSCGLCRRGFDRSNLIVWRRREITTAMRRRAAASAAAGCSRRLPRGIRPIRSVDERPATG